MKRHRGGTTQMVEQLYSWILVLGEEADKYNSSKREIFTLKAELLLKASSGRSLSTTTYKREVNQSQQASMKNKQGAKETAIIPINNYWESLTQYYWIASGFKMKYYLQHGILLILKSWSIKLTRRMLKTNSRKLNWDKFYLEWHPYISFQSQRLVQ